MAVAMALVGGPHLYKWLRDMIKDWRKSRVDEAQRVLDEYKSMNEDLKMRTMAAEEGYSNARLRIKSLEDEVDNKDRTLDRLLNDYEELRQQVTKMARAHETAANTAEERVHDLETTIREQARVTQFSAEEIATALRRALSAREDT